MSQTKIDSQNNFQRKHSGVRKSSMIVNLSTTEKRSSYTTLLTSTAFGKSSSSSKSMSKIQQQQVSSSSNSMSNSRASLSLDRADDSCTWNDRANASSSSVGSTTTTNSNYNSSPFHSSTIQSGPQSAPPSLTQPSYSSGAKLDSMDDTDYTVEVQTKQIDDEITNSNSLLSMSSPLSSKLQVIEVSELDKCPRQQKNPASSGEVISSEELSSRRNSREDSPEPIVEVKHTSSSASSSSSSSNSSNSSDCEDSSTKLIRRRTVRRYHRAIEEQKVDHTQPSAREENSPKKQTTSTELTISIDRSPSNRSGRQEDNNDDNLVKNHYRTRQIGAYYGQAKERQHQTSSSSKTSSSSSSSSSSTSTSTSKIAKCSITTNRKSTTSHHKLVSESSSSSTLSSSAKTATGNSSAAATTNSMIHSDGSSSRTMAIRPTLDHQFNDNLFERQHQNKNGGGFVEDKRSIQVQEQEEVHHSRQSFSSSTTSLLDSGLRKAAMASSSSSSASAEAALLSTSRHSQLASSALSASSTRHFKTSASLIVSGNNSSQQVSTRGHEPAASAFLNSELSSPDVRSLVREIGTDFAELENALISTSSGFGASGQLQNSRTGSSSLSTRLFGRRLSPIASNAHYPAISQSGSNHNLGFSDRQSTTLHANEHDDNNHVKYSSLFAQADSLQKDTDGSYSRSRFSAYSAQGGNQEKSNGDKIKELIDKARNHEVERPHSLDIKQISPTTPKLGDRLHASSEDGTTTNSREQEQDSSLLSKQQQLPATSDKAEHSSKESGTLHQNHCKAAMTESIERIDQRMSDLCKKFGECRDTKEAIDLLKIMIQMIEKAWSVPVCGDDLGFKLCNSLREAGGLDIILGFIHDSDNHQPSCQAITTTTDEESYWTQTKDPTKQVDINVNHQEEEQVHPSLSTKQQSSTQLKTNSNITNQPPNLRLNLSKVNQQSSAITTSSSDPASPPSNKQPSSTNKSIVTTPGGTKDSDSDVITSDLGLDSTSVESLSYVSAATQAPITSEQEKPTHEQTAASDSSEEKVDKVDQNETEDDVDLADETITIETTEGTLENLNEEEASLRKEELVFLSARLLSQCLTSENRNYIVDNGLRSVVKLACQFTTMKSTQSHRLLSRSMIMRQSSSTNNTRRQSSKSTIVQRKSSPSSSSHPNDLQQHDDKNSTGETKQLSKGADTTQPAHTDHSDMHAIIGTEILQHLYKHSEDTCSKIISLGGLQAILYGCRSSNIETLRHCASALANLALYGGPDSQQTMIVQKAHVWLFPLAFNEDDNIQYYACLAIVVLVANQEIEADVLKSSTLDLVEPFVTSHEPQRFAESTTAHIHGQSANWLRKLIPLLESKREEARNLACFHFAMEAYIKKEQDQTHVFKDIGAVEPLRKVGSSPIAIASKFACQALRLIGEKEPHKLSQQVPLWTSEDVVEWVTQIGFERFRQTFVDSRVDGDLLLQLDEEMLRIDIGIENGIIRRRFLRELSNLKRIADYSSADKSGLSSLLGPTSHDFIQYIYPMLQLGVTRDNIHLLDCEQLLSECNVSNTIHRMKLTHAIKDIQEKMATAAASNECNSIDGSDQKTLDVFVSYRRATGSQLASLLKVHLQLRGFSVFIDVERLEAGKFDNNLLDSIKTAKNFILVLSPSALDRCIGDHECKDWIHKEIVAALSSNCNIIPIMDNFHWPDAEQLPEDMRSITYFNGVRWIHDYQDACVDKVERFIRGEINNGGFGAQSNSSTQSTMHRVSGGGTYPSTPSIVATPSISTFPPGSTVNYPIRPQFDSDYHPLSFASQYLQHSQNASQIRR